MGIRYYAYSFDGRLTEKVIADPLGYLSNDLFADQWGLEHGAAFSTSIIRQTPRERDMLDLDKAWRHLQWLTAPLQQDQAPRLAYRMFEGEVAMNCMGWDPWVRTLTPAGVCAVATDLETITDGDLEARLRDSPFYGRDPEREFDYAVGYLREARTFASALAADGRGMVYTIG